VTGPPPSRIPAAGGILLVDKHEGPTSHDVVDEARRILAERRVGHTGTLDPFASGLLVLCLGPATRLAEFLSGLDKEYQATFLLGRRTATHDPEGEVVGESDSWRALHRADVESALSQLLGTIAQVPPSFSAKKLGGEPAHRRARRGEAVDLAAVPVTVHELELLEMALPEVRVRISCSSGTYVRALARDLGDALRVGAHVSRLRRTRVGRFHVRDALHLSALREPERWREGWLDPAEALSHLPSVSVDEPQAARLARGLEIDAPLGGIAPGETVLVLRETQLVAVGIAKGSRLAPRKVFLGKVGS
jgi:tRNA pseudouridine55 synthase